MHSSTTEAANGRGSKPFTIKLSKLLGVERQRMLCSARALKLSEDHCGLLILLEDTPVGQDVRDTLTSMTRSSKSS
ncbi:hypothetical protein [Burkholderia stagnalis]|uniref:hypothetical protein n=1 Tax=Burkholderia stagnalis TaxID=1503054 RepID=UPI00075F1BE8|nr:hypothetical protein WT07_31595 [Burkholderia stagnalis]KWD95243.1 hypothetical protein WT47_30175 [Burkholderia stagnalis]KWE23125.1 hypothetical protein WT48_05095 [Burkholderia stagnalis]KWO73453.1 hypothetical protein WU00_13960 [Burkholderia stagnalis]